MMDLVEELGFLPFFDCGIDGFSADELVDPECRYRPLPDGGWDWPLWDWKGPIVKETHCAYGKFFNGKAGFISREWWPHFCNWRRSRHARPEEGSIEELILATLREHGSMVARELRAACDFTGKNMRSRFDAYVGRLQMATYIVTEDFVYPVDKHGREYGFGWSLLTTPERLMGQDGCSCEPAPQESYRLMAGHLAQLLPSATAKQIDRLLK